LGFGAVVFRLIRTTINCEQQIAFLDLLAFLEMNLVKIAADARADFDGLRRFEPSDVFVPFDNLALDWLHDGDSRRLRSDAGFGLAASSAKQCDSGDQNSRLSFHRAFVMI